MCGVKVKLCRLCSWRYNPRLSVETQSSMPVNVLNLPGLRVLDFKETDTDYHVKAEPTIVSKLCPHCGRSNETVAHAQKTLFIRDLPSHGKRVAVHLDVPRLRCKPCGRATSEPTCPPWRRFWTQDSFKPLTPSVHRKIRIPFFTYKSGCNLQSKLGEGVGHSRTSLALSERHWSSAKQQHPGAHCLLQSPRGFPLDRSH